MNIPTWTKSAYVTYIGIPPFFRLEGCPSEKEGKAALALWFPVRKIISYPHLVCNVFFPGCTGSTGTLLRNTWIWWKKGWGYGIMILLTQNSSQLTLSCHRAAMHYTGSHGLSIKCLLRSRLMVWAHGTIGLTSNVLYEEDWLWDCWTSLRKTRFRSG